MNPLRIWSSFEPELLSAQSRLAGFASLEIIGSRRVAADPGLAEADIAFGQPDPQQVIELPNLKWIHLSTAGYTPYDRDDLRSALTQRSARLTNSSSVFDEPCAQHALAMMLGLARRLPQALDDQRGKRVWPAVALRSTSRLLNGQTALLVGYGAIGKRLAELLAPFHLNLTAFRRKPRGDESIRCLPIDQLDEALPHADHVINLLPGSASTNELFNASRFAKMNPRAIFYNIGRGTTVNQTALRHALESGKLATAYLDVTTPEPLPPDDPLWFTPNCYITPHTAGGHTNEKERIVEHFLKNLSRFERGEHLQDRVI